MVWSRLERFFECAHGHVVADVNIPAQNFANGRQQLFLWRCFHHVTVCAGADGYVMKTAPKEELLAAIREILSGNIYVSHDVAMRAFKKTLESRPDHRSASSATGIEKLSDREMHVFHLLGSGLGNTQIARSLHLSVKTIESHRENIKHKLDLSCSRDLVACAKKYVEETFLPAAKGALAIRGKKKVVRFTAA